TARLTGAQWEDPDIGARLTGTQWEALGMAARLTGTVGGSRHDSSTDRRLTGLVGDQLGSRTTGVARQARTNGESRLTG
ncbi:hypothetical protein, partial [Xylanibacillus composti]